MAVKQLKIKKPWTNRTTAYPVGSTQPVDVFDPKAGEKPADDHAIDADQLANLVKDGTVEVVSEAAAPAAEKAAKK